MPRQDVGHVRRRPGLGRSGRQGLTACRDGRTGRGVNGADGVHLLRRLRARPRRRRRVGAPERVQRAGRAVQLVGRRAGTVVAAGASRRGPGQTAPEPGVAERGVGRHSRRRIPLQTPTDEVQEERIVATLERRLELPGAGGPPRLAPP